MAHRRSNISATRDGDARKVVILRCRGAALSIMEIVIINQPVGDGKSAPLDMKCGSSARLPEYMLARPFKANDFVRVFGNTCGSGIRCAASTACRAYGVARRAVTACRLRVADFLDSRDRNTRRKHSRSGLECAAGCHAAWVSKSARTADADISSGSDCRFPACQRSVARD
jgi:hypothetical protein